MNREQDKSGITAGNMQVSRTDNKNNPSQTFHVRNSIAALKSIWEKQAAKRNVTISISVDPIIPECPKLNGFKIQHCLNNLMSNAVKFTQNGNIDIIVTYIKDKYCKQFIAFSIRDSGSGIHASNLGYIYDKPPSPRPFSQQPYGVIESGLPMTKALIEECGGQLHIKSKYGIGSVFSLILPFALRLNDPKPVLINPASNEFSHLNILIVDDYNLNQLTLKALLGDMVDKVYIASNGFEAIDVLHSCPVDIILMDIHMPLMDGIEATLKIRESKEAWSDVTIIALTADPHYQHTHLCRKIGMDYGLSKPVKRIQIFDCFRQLMPRPIQVASA